ncbi:MAG: 16S rRNA (guanine(527)-N(7))-methyltransferase RsmG [Nocardioides sp.]
MKHGESGSPEMPGYAGTCFAGSALETIQQFVDQLASVAVVRGLIGPREVPRLWDRHILNCVTLASKIGAGATVCDLGSGAGLPGLVLSIARPDVRVTLVEPLLRRTTFLTEVVAALRLDNVRVVRGRADSVHRSAEFDVVTSRALAPMSRLVTWSMPLVADGGSLLAIKGASVREELAAAAPVLAEFGCAAPEVLTLTQADGSSHATVVRVTWAAHRRVGLSPAPAKSTMTGQRRSSPRSPAEHRRRFRDESE